MNFALVLEEPQSDAVHRCIAPPLVKETTRLIKMVKVLTVLWAPPKVHIANLEVGPEVARRVAVRSALILRSLTPVFQPSFGAVAMYVILLIRQELERLRPQCAN